LRERKEAELRVRLEQEAAEKAEAHRRQLDHERELAAITATQRKGIHPGFFAAAAVLILALGTGWYFGAYKPEVERREAAAIAAKMEAERAAREAEEARAAAELEAQKRAEAEAEKERLAEQARREAQAAAAARRAAAPSNTPKRRSGSKPRKADTDDPLAGLDSL
jgi:colicin import membrane protein